MTPALHLMLDGMPEPRDLHIERDPAAGLSIVMVGPAVICDFGDGDLPARNLAIVTARRMKFTGKRVAEVFALNAGYVSGLNAAADRGDLAALMQNPGPGRPRGLTPARLAEARRLRAAGASDRQAGKRLGVAGTTIARVLGPRGSGTAPEPVPGQDALFSEDEARAGRGDARAPEPGPPAPPPAGAGAGAGAGSEAEAEAEAEAVPAGPARGPGGVIAAGRVRSRYAGAMLLHAFASRIGAAAVLGEAAGGDRAGTALLAAVSACFGLGAATLEQLKHGHLAEAGPLGGLAVLPELRTLRPALAAIADRAGPLRLQEMLAAAMLAADPVLSGVYYVDDHFVPYTGAKPVAKGWNNKRGRAGRGRADTHVTAHDGRAVCFVTGEPSGLVSTLPRALAELKKALPAGAPLMLGFDRGGAYAQVFTHCRDNGVHWVTWRRAPLAAPGRLPVLASVTVNGKAKHLAWAEGETRIEGYEGQVRQITLFEHGKAVMQVLTSDLLACPAAILSWLKSRWREENFLKYAAQNYGIDKICDYAAVISENSKPVRNPARDAANVAVRAAEKDLAAAERALAVLLGDPGLAPAEKNARIPAAQRAIARARGKLKAAQEARKPVPAKVPANQARPGAETALLNAGRRSLQMVLRLLARNAGHYLATRLNACLRDEDEYRAVTRETIIRGLAGTIDFTPDSVTVTLDRPGTPRVAAALAFLLDEISSEPAAIPGDTRPLAWRLAPEPA